MISTLTSVLDETEGLNGDKETKKHLWMNDCNECDVIDIFKYIFVWNCYGFYLSRVDIITNVFVIKIDIEHTINLLN